MQVSVHMIELCYRLTVVYAFNVPLILNALLNIKFLKIHKCAMTNNTMEGTAPIRQSIHVLHPPLWPSSEANELLVSVAMHMI